MLDRWVARLRDVDDLRGERVVVACSGGADSSALLALAVAAGLDVVAVHVDHGLRPGVGDDLGVVRRLAARLAVPVRAVAASLPGGGNVEARARDARYRALAAVADAEHAVAVLVGHTADDQAETVVLHLLRGGGLGALAGMPARHGAVRRPLLGLRRRDTREICAQLRIAWRDDPMNEDDAFARVWVRRRVLPALRAAADRDVVDVLARQAELAAADEAVLDELAAARLHAAGAPPLAAVVGAPPDAIARRALRLLVGPPPPSADEAARCLAVARGGRRAVQLRGGRRLERVGPHLAVVTTPVSTLEPVVIPVPGTARAGRWQVSAWIDVAPPVAFPDGRCVAVLDADAAGPELVVRAATATDRIRPLGLAGTKAVHDVLSEIGVARAARASHPIVASRTATGGEPLWVLGYRIADRVRVRHGTARFLWLSAEEDR